MAGPVRIPDVVLADALHRLSIAVAAGVDLRRAWAAETNRVPSRWRPVFAAVAARLAAGDGLGEAAAAGRGGIPAAVVGMLRVGDRTGRIAEVLEDTARNLSRAVATRRALRAALIGPAIRLLVAVVAIVVIVVATGSVRVPVAASPDAIGPGFVGRGGIGLGLAALLAAGILAGSTTMLARSSWRRRGWAWHAGRRLPVYGSAAVAEEAATWCRAAALAAHAGVSVGEMVGLASQAAAGLGCDPRRVEALLRSGHDLPEALGLAARLPRTVIEAVAVGEATGTTAEALDRVADQLEATASRGYAAVVQAVGFAAWALVACLVAATVIRVAATYARMIQDLTRPR